MSMYIAHMSNTTEWIAAAIRHALLDAGRTKRAVADETGIPYPTLNRKISGKRDFTLSELLSIAEATNPPPAAFIPPQFRPGAAPAAVGTAIAGGTPPAAPPDDAALTARLPPTREQARDPHRPSESSTTHMSTRRARPPLRGPSGRRGTGPRGRGARRGRER